ncbi:hypothetical protein [Humidisolicoccus flavus]|uniref:hypothetical protein n=1 Tax=Humidisolicoccus flavus TaxID=3111414 RepID=UPI00324D5BDF
MQVTAALLALDETLFDHEGASAEAVRAWLAGRGITPTTEIPDAWFASEGARAVGHPALSVNRRGHPISDPHTVSDLRTLITDLGGFS